MKSFIFTAILFCLYLFSASAQVRFCLTYADYQEGKWMKSDTLRVKKASKAKAVMLGTGFSDPSYPITRPAERIRDFAQKLYLWRFPRVGK